jgi:hypothetical protein
MRKPDLEIGGSENPYMRRWYLIPRNKWFCVYLHNMLRDDDNRALHDHPAANISIVLRGGYREVLFVGPIVPGMLLPQLCCKIRRPGTIVFRHADLAHRLELLRPVGSWSLFIMGPKLQNWGFWCGPRARWVPWQQFTAGPKGELIGQGCE